MSVPGFIFGTGEIFENTDAAAIQQVRNAACLPGIIRASIAMPDIHAGYGFCIGAVAAFDPANGGVISPGGVGYDINCGVRMLSSFIPAEDVKKVSSKIADALFQAVPAGVGSGGEIRLKEKELKRLLKKGALWAVENSMGSAEDLERIEEKGAVSTDPSEGISNAAIERAYDQAGTLGAGNHFLEVQEVEEIYDAEAAEAFGIIKGTMAVTLHTGSRGFGYQVCDDYLNEFKTAAQKYSINLPDSHLACVPIKSGEGRRYINAMNAAANFAWLNRQVISHLSRQALERVFGVSWEKMGLKTVYDISHNIARFEEHEVEGKIKKLCVHRKGATRALPAGHPSLPEGFKKYGHPVLIPGDMGRASYVMRGLEGGKEAFYSCSHGAGRLMSRSAAFKKGKGRDLFAELKASGVEVRVNSKGLLAEEAPYAYKDVSEVVEAVKAAGIAAKVAKLKPIAVVKG